ncbi:hypothetical protein NE237_014689 [Protea cynaroides]|uniref:Uncharacterized protein n=1 Tax=Protea cynaroides TaxID=273540 RepID=A0A9Q0KCG7_9MAGN|nr:hypothetical protein NE237_014689 [Protea cynaroides]
MSWRPFWSLLVQYAEVPRRATRSLLVSLVEVVSLVIVTQLCRGKDAVMVASQLWGLSYPSRAIKLGFAKSAPRSGLLGHADVPWRAPRSGLLGHAEVPKCRGAEECSAVRLVIDITEMLRLSFSLIEYCSNSSVWDFLVLMPLNFSCFGTSDNFHFIHAFSMRAETQRCRGVLTVRFSHPYRVSCLLGHAEVSRTIEVPRSGPWSGLLGHAEVPISTPHSGIFSYVVYRRVLRGEVYLVSAVAPRCEGVLMLRSVPWSNLLGHAEVPRSGGVVVPIVLQSVYSVMPRSVPRSGLLSNVEVYLVMLRCRGVLHCLVYSIMLRCRGAMECFAVKFTRSCRVCALRSSFFGHAEVLRCRDVLYG